MTTAPQETTRTLTESLVDQLEWHWQSHLRPRFDGLTDKEYFAEPVAGCWNVHPRGRSSAPVQAGSGAFTIDFAFPPPEPAPVTTIAWRLGHLIVGVFGVRKREPLRRTAVRLRVVRLRRNGHRRPRPTRRAARPLDRRVRALDDDALRRPVGPAEGSFAEAPMIDLVLHIHREVIHHGAEIALLRDLWAHGLPDQRDA